MSHDRRARCNYNLYADNIYFSQLDVTDRYIAANRECITIIVPSQELPVFNLIGWGEPGLGTRL